ncbi:hypothetical protein EPUL_000363 [Erysiphe pulchra]|uniref:Uncharacterized protein n=1 Tax=Erysiphe pulchra TaxID=225359 RepID=A0A2S4Q212_9PEZI|nr:hypothetical protein EPUL_000363 [Erysiphe pulchra]
MAATLLKYQEAIENRFRYAIEGLALIRDADLIRHVRWTCRSLNDESYGKIRICDPEIKASKFPSRRLRLFGEAVSVQRTRKRNLIITCEKCYGFHATRTCAWTVKCKLYGTEVHDEPCTTTPKCFNCRGPHSTVDNSCLARPCRRDGILTRLSRIQLQHIRLTGQKEFAKIINRQSSDSPTTSTAISGTEKNKTSNQHRSASDFTTALLCDIRKAWKENKFAGIVTTDVEEAFDGVLPNRLIYRLRSQEWPSCLVRWVLSFLSERSVCIPLDKITTEPLPIFCGLPQVSPVSPILLLYIEPLLRTSRSHFGYANNALDSSLLWASKNGVQLDAKKTELIYFHNKRKYIESPLSFARTIMRPKSELKWLAFATLFYGANTCYGPRKSQWALNQVQLTINRATRAVLPVYKTFPIPALLRKTGWGPANAWFDRIYYRLAVRIAAADPNHPLCRRWNSEQFS